MICTWCRIAADEGAVVDRCSGCGRGPVRVYNSAKPLEEQSVVVHKTAGAEPGVGDYWCPGGKKPPVNAHHFCTGCDCQHKPVGSHT